MKRAKEKVELKSLIQTKKEKLDCEECKIPQLNEDVMGIILRLVVQKQQKHVVRNVEVIGNHFSDPYDPKDFFEISFKDKNLGYNISWPETLKTNSRRLVHHAKLKMFPNVKMSIKKPLNGIVSNRELDLMLETFKHFDCIVDHLLGPMKPVEYICRQRKFLNHRLLFVKKLEEIKD